MVSPLVAQAILNQTGPDIVGSFSAGREEARRNQVRDLAGRAMQRDGGGALEELRGLDPEVAFAIGEQLRSRSANDINDFIRDSKIGLGMLRQNDFSGALSFARQRRNNLLNQGRDTTQTDQLIDQLESGDFEGARSGLESFATSLDSARQGAAQKAFAPITIVNEETGEERIVTPTFDPNTGAASLANTDIPVGFSVKSKRKTADEAGNVKLSEEQSKQSVSLSGKIFDKIDNINSSLLNIDDAISAIDSGAATGAIAKFLPSVRKSSVELDNIRRRMGLDVIGGTTFGALSKGELDLALDTALDTALPPDDLKEFLIRKRDAQKKLSAELSRDASELNRGATLADVIDRRKIEQESLASAAPQAEVTQEVVEVDF